MCMYGMFAKVPLGSGRNRLMFELPDLHKFMAKKTGVSSLDLAFIHRLYTQIVR